MQTVIIYLLDYGELTFSPVDGVEHQSNPDVLIIFMHDWDTKIVFPFDSFNYYKEVTS